MDIKENEIIPYMFLAIQNMLSVTASSICSFKPNTVGYVELATIRTRVQNTLDQIRKMVPDIDEQIDLLFTSRQSKMTVETDKKQIITQEEKVAKLKNLANMMLRELKCTGNHAAIVEKTEKELMCL